MNEYFFLNFAPLQPDPRDEEILKAGSQSRPIKDAALHRMQHSQIPPLIININTENIPRNQFFLPGSAGSGLHEVS